MKYTKLFNICEKKEGIEKFVGRLSVDTLDLSYKGKETRLSKGDYLTVRSTQEQIAALTQQLEKGIVTEELFEKRVESLGKTPDFVLAHIHVKNDEGYFPIGDILKSRAGGKYIKFKCDEGRAIDMGSSVILEGNQFISMNTKESELQRIQYLLDNNKMKQETFDKVKSQIESTPDFVKFRCDAKGREA